MLSVFPLMLVMVVWVGDVARTFDLYILRVSPLEASDRRPSHAGFTAFITFPTVTFLKFMDLGLFSAKK